MLKFVNKNFIGKIILLLFFFFPFTSKAALTITTNPATLIGNTSATLNAVVSVFNQNASVKFRYSSTNTASCSGMTNFIETSSQSYSYSGVSNGGSFNLSRNISGLLPGTTYYFCALDSGNAVYGSVLNFQTTGSSTGGGGTTGTNANIAASSITQNSATLIATNVMSPGGTNGAAETVYFRYTTGNPTSCSSMTNYQSSSSSSVGPFNNWSTSVNISGLSAGTSYKYCLVITPNLNIGVQYLYSGIGTFQTNSASGNTGGSQNNSGNIGNVKTHDPNNLTDTEATFDGSVNGVSGTAYGYFRYSAVDIPPIFCNEIYGSKMKSVQATTPNSDGRVSDGSFYAVAKGLKPNTQYAYCAVVSNKATNPTIIKYGDVEVFRTLPCQTCDKTSITTVQPIVNNNKSATLRGKFSSTKEVTTYFEYKKYIILATAGSTQTLGTPGNTGGGGAGIFIPGSPIYEWVRVNEKVHTPGNYSVYGNLNFKVEGLEPDTHYKVRAVAETSDPDEIFYGEVINFKTPKYNGIGPIPPDDPDDDSDNTDTNTGDDGTNSGDNGGNNGGGNGNGDNDGGGNGGGGNGGGNDDGNPGDDSGGNGGDNGGGNGGNGDGGNGDGSDGNNNDGNGTWNGNGNNDWDIDNDGNTNTTDGDVDGDGIPNTEDGDDDNDGIPDISDPTPIGMGSFGNYDADSFPNVLDSDMDGDGIPNVIDPDTDGDGVPNISDSDDDNDGIPDGVDSTPTGVGTITDYDGGGIPNISDSDMDGDGVSNNYDDDTDGDGIPNTTDNDDDNDGTDDSNDSTPTGTNGPRNPQIGDTAEPNVDDIVRYHEGIEHVFARRIKISSILQMKFGYLETGLSLQQFAYDLAHALAKAFGYVDASGREIRVSQPDVSAYQIRVSGNKLTVYEYYKNKIIDIRRLNSSFKNKNPYEYYFNKR